MTEPADPGFVPAGATAFRAATAADLADIVRLLANDPLGARRERCETPLPGSYYRAFAAIERDLNNELVVATSPAGQVIGVLQITFTPHITYQGGWRATIEGVRVDEVHRSAGVGESLIRWAIDRARARGCHLVQLTSDKQRPAAIRFYERLGFVASHEGMKLHL